MERLTARWMTHRRIQTFREHERVFTKKEKKQEKTKRNWRRVGWKYDNNPSAHSIFSAHRVGRGASYKYISNRQFYSLFRRFFFHFCFVLFFFFSSSVRFCPRATKKSVTPSSLSSAMTPGIYASAIRLYRVRQQIDICLLFKAETSRQYYLGGIKRISNHPQLSTESYRQIPVPIRRRRRIRTFLGYDSSKTRQVWNVWMITVGLFTVTAGGVSCLRNHSDGRFIRPTPVPQSFLILFLPHRINQGTQSFKPHHPFPFATVYNI